jgi:hypothetical protein
MPSRPFRHPKSPLAFIFRTYNRGINPCFYCSIGRHNTCRQLKLDGTSCSCNCPRAEEFHKEYYLQYELAKERGEPLENIFQKTWEDMSSKRKKIN